MRRYKGTFDIFFGVEHRGKKKWGKKFGQEAKQGWRFAADSARITNENASNEDCKHTSGGVFVAIGSNLSAVIGKEEGAVESIQATRKGLPKHGRFASLFGIHLALERLDTEK